MRKQYERPIWRDLDYISWWRKHSYDESRDTDRDYMSRGWTTKSRSGGSYSTHVMTSRSEGYKSKNTDMIFRQDNHPRCFGRGGPGGWTEDSGRRYPGRKRKWHMGWGFWEPFVSFTGDIKCVNSWGTTWETRCRIPYFCTSYERPSIMYVFKVKWLGQSFQQKLGLLVGFVSDVTKISDLVYKYTPKIP